MDPLQAMVSEIMEITPFYPFLLIIAKVWPFCDKWMFLLRYRFAIENRLWRTILLRYLQNH